MAQSRLVGRWQVFSEEEVETPHYLFIGVLNILDYDLFDRDANQFPPPGKIRHH